MSRARENYQKSLSEKTQTTPSVEIEANSHLILAAQTNGASNFPPQYFSGSQLLNLYNIPSVSATTTKKVKIAIIVAYSYAKIKTDLEIYWKNDINFGANATPPSINVYTMPGAKYNALWALEECLDVQMVCTVNPNANIWVVEATSNQISDLMTALNYATETLLVDVVSMSWGAKDTRETLVFNKNFANTNVCYCASTGDTNTVCWPAVLSNCAAIGGTTLIWTPNSTPSRKESAWYSGGCGYSSTIVQPDFQANIPNIKRGFRCIPDVSMISNMQTSVYTVFNGNWYGIGGTSVASPIFAGILSLANQMRFNKNKTALTTVLKTQGQGTQDNHLQTYLYKIIYPNPLNYAAAFYDVTIGIDRGSVGGNNPFTSTVEYGAVKGFDIATGLGSPNATSLCDQLLKM